MPIANDDTTLLSSDRRLEQVWASSKGTDGLKESLDSLQARLAIPARYEVIEELGRGGMGIVYRVRDIETCEIIALKILKPEIAADPAMRESLRKEVCLARKVTHKNVCRIYEFARSETTVCISMEYVPGESLLAKMHRRGALSVADAIEIAQQICAGLAEAHAQGIVHRDLKPANIVIARDKTVKIMDFGVARRARETAEPTEELAGTPAYMSPEQLEMKPVTPRTDVYALGLILYELVTGTSAFTGEDAIAIALQQIRRQPNRPSALVPAIPARLDAAILKCLEKDPAKRFASVEELSAALDKATAPVTAEPKTPIEYKYFRAANATLQKLGRAALRDAKQLRKEIEQGATSFRRTAQPHVERWIAAARSFSFRTPATKRAQALVLSGALFSAAVAFGVVMRKESHTEQKPPVSHAVPAGLPAHAPLASSAAPQAASFEPVSPFTAKEFEFEAPSSSADDGSDDSTESDQPRTTKSPRMARASFSSGTSRESTRSHQAPKEPEAAPSSSPAFAAQALAPLSVGAVGVLPLDDPKGESSLLALEPVPAVKKPDLTLETATPLPDPYLEVGSFNDEGWANDAVTQLSHLGLTARAVRKNHLWMQSYHVEVGPFKTLSALEAAEKTLADKGFKARAVK
jgi:serine/threonine protein kinase